MPIPTFLRRFVLFSFSGLLILAGCSSEASPEEPGGTSSGPRRKAPTPMAGQESFFDGQILAEISVGTEGLPEVGPREGGGNRGGGEHSRRSGGGRLNIAGSGGAVGGNISGGIPFGAGGEGRGRYGGHGGGGEGDSAPGPRPMMGGMGRPVMIHLRFTNNGTATVTLAIDDFVSLLGNFAVRPEKLVLEPGQSLETEPMTSQLAGELSEANATLVLRVGPKTEKKTFTLHALPGDRPGQAPAK